jgi:hypothetical protein
MKKSNNLSSTNAIVLFKNWTNLKFKSGQFSIEKLD